jgi:hypothetical protein
VTGIILSQIILLRHCLGKEPIMANIITFIPSYLELPKDGNNGVVKGDFVDLKNHAFVKAELTIAPEAKIVPFTQKGLARLQEHGYFTNVPVEPVLGKTAYRLTLDENGCMVKMQYRYTKEQREKLCKNKLQDFANTYGWDEDDEADLVNSTSILKLINA